jgi:hypothetical protein
MQYKSDFFKKKKKKREEELANTRTGWSTPHMQNEAKQTRPSRRRWKEPNGSTGEIG